MSIVVVGGNDRMTSIYKDICRSYDCKAKIFTQMPANFADKIGKPDLVVIFTNTVSHQMVVRVNQRAQKLRFPVARVNSAGAGALRQVLSEYVGAGV
ncbi:MAG: DUF2325 domain-containing protein [Oscillospiraceae bacterium]|nr:DUF2325 domain-containing protein [Oscillospiraceae bacterium]